MNKKLIPVLVMLLLIFAQCKKEKNDSPPPDLSKGLLAYFELNGSFNDSADAFNVNYGGFLSNEKNRHGYGSRAMGFNGGLFSFTTPFWRANSITISLWVKPKDLNNDNNLVLSMTGAFAIMQKQSQIGLTIGNPDTATAFAPIAVEWTHVLGTYNGTDIKTYINGKLASTVRHPGVPDVTNAVLVGAQGPPEWKGVIDDLRFYNRVLTEEEIRLLVGL